MNILNTGADAYRDKKCRDAHYQAVIQPKIDISETEVRRVYQYMQESRHVRHLFADTKEKADSLRSLLASGVPFDSLARMIYQDAELRENGGDLGWIKWDELDYPLAMTAF
ncbi:MAG: peptidylprolyl isomerase [candidate division KSB1 bacterium]|nr:peptidylprolyl isomerase [candidate division KSB1 bacterium]